MRKYLALFLLLVAVPAYPWSLVGTIGAPAGGGFTGVLNETFESGNGAGWTTDSGTPAYNQDASAVGMTGTYCARMNQAKAHIHHADQGVGTVIYYALKIRKSSTPNDWAPFFGVTSTGTGPLFMHLSWSHTDNYYLRWFVPGLGSYEGSKAYNDGQTYYFKVASGYNWFQLWDSDNGTSWTLLDEHYDTSWGDDSGGQRDGIWISGQLSLDINNYFDDIRISLSDINW